MSNLLLLKYGPTDEISAQIKQWLEDGPIQGLYFLPTLDAEETFTKMELSDWQAALDEHLHSLVAAVRALPVLSFLVVATRGDGLHGFSGAGIHSTMSAAAAGFAKAIARERSGITVKVVDFETSTKPTVAAGRLIEETRSDPAVVEVGWEGDQRFTLVLTDQALAEDGNQPLAKGSVFLISGGSGGITAPIINDLAQATQGHFYLLGRSSQPDAQDQDLAMARNNPEQLRITLMERLIQQGQKATPAIVNQQIAALQRAAATQETIKQVEKTGGKATYLVCDVTDQDAVKATVEAILAKEDHIDVLIHAAGIERSRKLESKSDQEFRQIVDIKATGFFNLFKVLENLKKTPQAIVTFGSVAGRFGNTGQTDYSAANNLLARLSYSIHSLYPQIQVVTIDWGAWAEVGMASRGHIPELMRRAGIAMLDPQQAGSLVRRELESGSNGEVILAGSLGVLETQQDPEGGLDIEKANLALTSGEPIHVMLSSAVGVILNEGILLEVELDPTHEPFLKDHALNGIPLLPGVMGIEGFSIAAQHIASSLGSAGSGFRVEALSDIEFLTPFKFYRGEARRITWKAQVVRESSGLVAFVTLESKVARPMGRLDEMKHFQGKVLLVPASQPHTVTTAEPPHWNGAYTVQAADIYKLYFHGPSFQVLEGVQLDGKLVLGKLNKKLPPITENEKLLLSVPVLVELCFQTAGVWEIGTNGSLSLPQSIGCLKIFENKVNGVPIYAEVTPKTMKDGEVQFNARVIDSKGQVYLEIENYRTSRLPYSVEQTLLTPLRTLVN